MSRVLLLGDHITDIYRFGHCPRLCPEGPVPIFVTTEIEAKPGGAALVASNLSALGCVVDSWYGTRSEKIRFFSGNHLLLREDKDATVALEPLPDDLEERIQHSEAVMVSDYAKGAITDEAARRIIALADAHSRPTFVDTKRPNPGVYAGCYAIFPNESEAARLGDRQQYRHVVHKAGRDGCFLDGDHISTIRQEAFDVTGAGDVFLAAFVAAHLGGESLEQSAHIANQAAGISVRHIGGYVLTPTDIGSLSLFWPGVCCR